MDVDNGGSVSLRELKRVLMGDMIRTLFVNFDHPDSGIAWTTDDENFVVIKEIDPISPAVHEPSLIKSLRLKSVNGIEIPPSSGSLQRWYQLIIEIHNEPITLEFFEPIIIITDFSNALDVEMHGVLCEAKLPVGAVYNVEKFEKDVREVLDTSHPFLKWLKFTVERRGRQVIFDCKRLPFRLLFGSGPSSHLSCRYALGFSSEDTEEAHVHAGQPMLIDLNLGVTSEETEVLLEELFVKFDKDGSGEFEFEEFRDFYVKVLDTDESRDLLRRFARYRFRDLEKEAWWKAKMEEKRRRAARRKALREKNAALVAQQKATFMANSVVGEDNVRRRILTKEKEHELRRLQLEEARKKKKGYARYEEEKLMREQQRRRELGLPEIEAVKPHASGGNGNADGEDCDDREEDEDAKEEKAKVRAEEERKARAELQRNVRAEKKALMMDKRAAAKVCRVIEEARRQCIAMFLWLI